MARIQALSMAIAGTVGTIASLGIAAGSAQALIITNNFRVDMTDGFLAGETFFGSFTYDNAALTDPSLALFDPGDGNRIINASNGLIDVSFNFLGQAFNQSSDIGFIGTSFSSPTILAFPQLNFRNGEFLGLDLIVSEFLSNPVSIPGSTFEFALTYDRARDFPFFIAVAGGLEEPEFSFGLVTYDVKPIPTPALLPSLVGMGIAVLKKRKREAS